MKPIKIKPDIYWVGAIDWDLRNFHGYLTQRGSTYNSYLIIDEKITLVDTVKHYKFDEMAARIKQVIDPSKIDYIICNHVEMDHSGSIPKMLEIAPNAKIFASPNGKRGLEFHFKVADDVQVVKQGDEIKIGKRTLQFYPITMVHWPDSMMTYCPEEKLLMPNDAFGQHIASSQRYADELEWGLVYEEASKYYANIVMPYGPMVNKALKIASGLDIDMIAPSHGLIWRKDLGKIISHYAKWANNETEEKAVIVYDSMWHSTEKLAYALHDGLEDAGVPTVMRSLQANHISDVIADVLTSKGVFIGSPTLNNGMLPTMGGFLTYMGGLKPTKRIGFAFGSYGWGGQSIKEIHKFIVDLKWEAPFEGFNVQYIPSEEKLAEIRETGGKLGEMIKKKVPVES
ncbi:MAG: FprA family A-type flavoprotein [Candidatus Eremiobacteraeota bacterium]|nr:FprA family A-type flavoprotein [Candidatus Eremiobacteraeota bacterium]